jgi:hypothetical protein
MAHLETKVYESIRLRYNKGVNKYNNIKHLLGNQMIYVYILIMLFYLSKTETNLISFIMYSFNILLIGSVCYQDKSLGHI